MELHDALSQIAEIRAGMARGAVFRGFRSLTVAFSGVLALAAAAVQDAIVPDPIRNLSDYLALWVSAAGVCLFATGLEIAVRRRRTLSFAARRATVHVIEQFLPCVVAGAFVTAAIARRAPESAWMLPGLWSILFGLGVFSIGRLLPRPTASIGVFYLVSGLVLLAGGSDGSALSPWSMGAVFGPGQLASAAILRITLERRPGELHEPQ